MITISKKEDHENSKKRNVFLTILLTLFFIVDLFLLKTIFDKDVDNDFTDLSENVNYLYVVFTFFDLIFTYYLFKWKKWAFWGTLTVAILTFCLNLYSGLELSISLIGLISILLLIIFLQLKRNKISGWNNLE